MSRRRTALAAALSLLPLGQPLLLGTLAGITTATTAVVLQAPPVVAQDSSAVARVAKAITVRIEGATQGSGVLVKREGNRYTVLTAWHVVSGNRPGEELAIFTPDGKEHQLEQGSIQRLGQVDMAVLTFSSGGAYEVASVGDIKSVSMGNQIFVAGFPLATSAVDYSILRFLKGDVIANASVAIANGYQLLYSNPTLPGMSGGSVLNRQGKLVGIHGQGETDAAMTEQRGVAVKTGTNQAVPISYYKQFDTGQTVIASRTQATSADDFLAQAGALEGVKGRESEMIRLANQALALQPSALGYFIRAVPKNDSGDYSGAIADYSKAIAINPLYAVAYNNRGIAKYYLKNHQGAISDYNKAIAIDPQLASAYTNRGAAKLDSNDYQGAMKDSNMAIAIDPQSVNAYMNRGIAKSYFGNHQEAIADYNKALGFDPQYSTIYWNRALAKKKLKDYQGAIADYNKVIRINPNDTAVYANRGIAKTNLGDDRGGCADYKKAVSLGDQSTAQWLNSEGGAWCRNMR